MIIEPSYLHALSFIFDRQLVHFQTTPFMSELDPNLNTDREFALLSKEIFIIVKLSNA